MFWLVDQGNPLQCNAQINSKLQNPPEQLTGIWPLAGWGGEFGPNVPSLSSRKTYFTLKYRRLKVKSSPSRVNGSEKGLQGLGFKVWRIGRKSRSLFLPCRKKNVLWYPTLGWDIWTQLWPGGAVFYTNQSKQIQAPGGLAQREDIEASNWSTRKSRESITMQLGDILTWPKFSMIPWVQLLKFFKLM